MFDLRSNLVYTICRLSLCGSLYTKKKKHGAYGLTGYFMMPCANELRYGIVYGQLTGTGEIQQEMRKDGCGPGRIGLRGEPKGRVPERAPPTPSPLCIVRGGGSCETGPTTRRAGSARHV